MNQLTAKMKRVIALQDIKDAERRIRDVVLETPFAVNTQLSQKYGCHVYLKREDQQIVRSFKIRGAYNKMAQLSKDELEHGIVCASAGNHAQGVAFACNKLKVKGKVVMPNPTPSQKINKVRDFGGEWVEIILKGDTYDDAYAEAISLCQKSRSTFIHPFNDEQVIAGQATIGLEILKQTQNPIDILLIAVGGGGLIAGVGSCFQHLSPSTEIICVEAEGAPTFHHSVRANALTRLQSIDSFADGIAVKEMGSIPFTIAKQFTSRHVLIPEGKICTTMLELYNDQGIIVEPSGAVGVAALDQLGDSIKGKTIAIILCGGNNDVDRLNEVRERSLLHEGFKHYFIIKFPQRAGALKEFLNLLGPSDDITHFEYTKKTNRVAGPALVGIELNHSKDFESLIERMTAASIQFQHLNENPMLFEMLV